MFGMLTPTHSDLATEVVASRTMLPSRGCRSSGAPAHGGSYRDRRGLLRAATVPKTAATILMLGGVPRGPLRCGWPADPGAAGADVPVDHRHGSDPLASYPHPGRGSFGERDRERLRVPLPRHYHRGLASCASPCCTCGDYWPRDRPDVTMRVTTAGDRAGGGRLRDGSPMLPWSGVRACGCPAQLRMQTAASGGFRGERAGLRGRSDHSTSGASPRHQQCEPASSRAPSSGRPRLFRCHVRMR